MLSRVALDVLCDWCIVQVRCSLVDLNAPRCPYIHAAAVLACLQVDYGAMLSALKAACGEMGLQAVEPFLAKVRCYTTVQG